MSNEYINSKAGLATECGVARSTVYRWMKHRDWPRETPQGWERVKVLEFAKGALARAAKAQTGEHSDLRRRKLELQCEVLLVQLQRAKGSLSVEQSGVVPRDAVVAELSQVGLATWQALNNYIITEGNTTLRGNVKGYSGLCGLGSDMMSAIRKLVMNRLKESPIKLTADELETAEMYLGFQW